jgi:predicted N-acyltransferase
MYYYGESEVVHHINKDKADNRRENLMPMTKSEHTKLHHTNCDYRSFDMMMKSVNSMANKRRRNDVTSEKVMELKNKGATIPQIAKELNCGINTVNRRLGMKDY